MLSILIPTYNYTVTALVTEVHRQAVQTNIPFEIIVLDDASTDKESTGQNLTINKLPHCRYEVLEVNSGRSKVRNLLADKAKFDWLLFLDADTMPVSGDFIQKYIPHLSGNEKVVYGGIKYQEEKPQKEKILRWVYGNEREALSVAERKKEPYLSLLTLNFAISKQVFSKVRFNENIPNLRHEDTLFSYELSKEKITVEHIANVVLHLGLDNSRKFLIKSEEAVIGLKYLLDSNLLPPDYVKISGIYKLIKQAGMTGLFRLLFELTAKKFRKNLLGSKPSLFIFDLYRLGYLCSLK
ncbi:glycosyltransferase family 2 protein [Flavobacterium sp. MK4S-17]|uniref:glycosyltransferase family 2 protein n=1 Tax=Flavobacterium sp. MK4S-17 TaxID=2543737 RepID=UPI00135B0AEB|nr:glycosyltransferase family 2 protein [Flavobacterium sp. MK4S-17]